MARAGVKYRVAISPGRLRVLDEQKWWGYGARTHQHCYDWSHVMAIARYVSVKDALAKLPEFENTPFGYDSYDETPAHTLMAYAWLAGLEGK